RIRVLVHAEHPRGAPQRGVDAEAAGEAEAVEDARAGRQPAYQRAVLSLIEEEPGLLPAAHVHAKAHAALLDDDRVGGLLAPEEAGAAPSFFVTVLAAELVASEHRAHAGKRPQRLDQHPP